jgi:hypothetical protein
MLNRSKTQFQPLPPILTALALALAGLLAMFFSWQMVVFYLAMLPVPLTLLWGSRYVPSPAERIAMVDEAHRAGLPHPETA